MKKIISFTLCVVMVISLLCFAVNAASTVSIVADNSGFEYSTYTLAFRVDDDDNWVEVYLYEDDIEDWSADQFKEVYEEIFE